jgi:hypothetical protein
MHEATAYNGWLCLDDRIIQQEDAETENTAPINDYSGGF